MNWPSEQQQQQQVGNFQWQLRALQLAMESNFGANNNNSSSNLADIS